MVVHALHEEEEKDRREQCMEHYLVAMEDIKRRGKELIGIKRIAGDSSDRICFQIPLTEAQVHEYREMLRIEKQQLQADKAQLFAEPDYITFPRLYNQPVLDKNWDVEARAGSVLEEVGVAATDKVMEYVVQSVHTLTQWWEQCHKLIDESSDEDEMAFEQVIDSKGNFFVSYDL